MKLTWNQRWKMYFGSRWHMFWMYWHLKKLKSANTIDDIKYHHKKTIYHLWKI